MESNELEKAARAVHSRELACVRPTEKVSLRDVEIHLGIGSYVYLGCKNKADEQGNVNCEALHISEKYRLYKTGLISYETCWSMHCRPLPSHSVCLWEICIDGKGRDAIGFVWAAEFYGPEHLRQRHLCYSSGYGFCTLIGKKKVSAIYLALVAACHSWV